MRLATEKASPPSALPVPSPHTPRRPLSTPFAPWPVHHRVPRPHTFGHFLFLFFCLFQNFNFGLHRLGNKGFILLTHTSLYTFYILLIKFHQDFLLKLLFKAYMTWLTTEKQFLAESFGAWRSHTLSYRAGCFSWVHVAFIFHLLSSLYACNWLRLSPD